MRSFRLAAPVSLRMVGLSLNLIVLMLCFILDPIQEIILQIQAKAASAPNLTSK